MFHDTVGMSQGRWNTCERYPPGRNGGRLPKHSHLVSERFEGLNTPMLALESGDNSAFLKTANKAVDEALPDCRIVMTAGHVAMDPATDLFTTEALRFMEGPQKRVCHKLPQPMRRR